MNAEAVAARSAIESLRSGVPSRHAVTQLGTTQTEVKKHFDAGLQALAEGRGVTPIVVSATFGAGKSHLLNYLQSLAAQQGFVTSFVVVSPEMPLGNASIVLRTLAEAAQAPGNADTALRALAAQPEYATGTGFADLKAWTRDAGLDDQVPRTPCISIRSFGLTKNCGRRYSTISRVSSCPRQCPAAKTQRTGRSRQLRSERAAQCPAWLIDRLRLLAQGSIAPVAGRAWSYSSMNWSVSPSSRSNSV